MSGLLTVKQVDLLFEMISHYQWTILDDYTDYYIEEVKYDGRSLTLEEYKKYMLGQREEFKHLVANLTNYVDLIRTYNEGVLFGTSDSHYNKVVKIEEQISPAVKF